MLHVACLPRLTLQASQALQHARFFTWRCKSCSWHKSPRTLEKPQPRRAKPQADLVAHARLGLHLTEIAAAKAYDRVAIKKWGHEEAASKINFPMEQYNLEELEAMDMNDLVTMVRGVHAYTHTTPTSQQPKDGWLHIPCSFVLRTPRPHELCKHLLPGGGNDVDTAVTVTHRWRGWGICPPSPAQIALFSW